MAFSALQNWIDRHGLTWAVASVLLATLAFLPMRALLPGEQWGWAYLLVVALVAGTSRVRLAVLSAVIAFFAWNYVFIRPYYTLHVNDPGDLIHLTTFLFVAVLIALQTGRLRESNEAERRHRLRTAALYRLSADMVQGISPNQLACLTDTEVRQVLGAEGVAIWVRPSLPGGLLSPLVCESGPRVDAAAFTVVYDLLSGGDQPDVLSANGCTFLRLSTASGDEGVLQVFGRDSLDRGDLLFAESIAHLAAVYLENRRVNELAIHASAAREAEKLRAALVSSVSHELKTPLASLTASVTDLIARGKAPSPAELSDSLRAMADDLRRLDSSIGNLLDASRLEAHAWKPSPTAFEMGELIGLVCSDLGAEARERVDFSVPDGLPLVYADFGQVARALGHLVDNALRYSSGRVTVGAHATGVGLVKAWVEDHGPGIPEAERTKIFERFYRGSTGKQSQSSTGLGLFLAQEIVTANGGHIHVEEASPHGALLVMSLPAYTAEVPSNLLTVAEG